MTQLYTPTPQTRENAHAMLNWVRHQNLSDTCIHCPDCGSISFCTDRYLAQIEIDEDIVSLYMEEKATGEQVFFLHFQAVDLDDSIEKVKVFLYRLYHDEDQDDNEEKIPDLHQPIEMLICCTSGITSTMYARLITRRLGSDLVHADAKSVFNLTDEDDQYDLILLAPQVHYMFEEVSSRFPGKVHRIETMDFATDRISGTLRQLNTLSESTLVC
ncbi:hypothetical protein AAK899_03785 [Erysipelotrichaceae bacterium 51-3]